jgi:peptidoglycan/xylan/chitin deacetylase (PgdA/CDA1 family)
MLWVMMAKKAYQFFIFLVRFSGLPAFFRFFFARNCVSMVIYHNPKPEVFEMHLEYFARKYHLISISELIGALDSGNFQNLPKYSLVVTLDDGWKENVDLLPVVKKFKFKPVVFLSSNLIGTERHFWWTTCEPSKVDALKSMSNRERINELRQRYSYNHEKEYAGERQALSYQEIEKMKSNVDFGLHTCNHPVLTRCTTEEKRKEIRDCKTQLEALLGEPVISFSYPNGDYDDECIEILKECGVKVARTTDAGWNHPLSNPYKLKVTGVSDNSSKNKLIAELTGIPMFLQYLSIGRINGVKSN